MIKRIDVSGEAAFAYLREQLNMSGPLGKLLLSTDISKGRVFAYVPETTPVEYLYRFHAGGLYPVVESSYKKNKVPVQNKATAILINHILQYLKKSESHCCLFEEPNAKPSDPWVTMEKIEYVQLDEEMFYFFNNKVQSENFEKSIKNIVGYYFLCTLSSLPVAMQNGFSPFSFLTVKQLNDYASKCCSFFVNAYDYEGYLEWNKECHQIYYPRQPRFRAWCRYENRSPTGS